MVLDLLLSSCGLLLSPLSCWFSLRLLCCCSRWHNTSDFCRFGRTLPSERLFLFCCSPAAMHLPSARTSRPLSPPSSGGELPQVSSDLDPPPAPAAAVEECIGRAPSCSPSGVRAAVIAAGSSSSRRQDLDLHLRFLRQEPAVAAGGNSLHTLRAPHAGLLPFVSFWLS